MREGNNSLLDYDTFLCSVSMLTYDKGSGVSREDQGIVLLPGEYESLHNLPSASLCGVREELI
jgi:hypothetical protein